MHYLYVFSIYCTKSRTPPKNSQIKTVNTIQNHSPTQSTVKKLGSIKLNFYVSFYRKYFKCIENYKLANESHYMKKHYKKIKISHPWIGVFGIFVFWWVLCGFCLVIAWDCSEIMKLKCLLVFYSIILDMQVEWKLISALMAW